MQALGLEMQMTLAQKIIDDQKGIMDEQNAIIQRKNLKLAYNLLRSGQLDGLSEEESITLLMEEIEVEYDEALALYDSLFQN